MTCSDVGALGEFLTRWHRFGSREFREPLAYLDRRTTKASKCDEIDRGLGYAAIEVAGVSVGSPEKKMGQLGSDVCNVNFENVRRPGRYLLGAEGGGFKIAMRVLYRGRLHIAALCVGIAERLIRDCVAYTNERTQFGQRSPTFN